MILSLVLHTLRECHRRPFPYVAAVVISLLAFASHLFQVFSFGAGELEATNLALSAVFLAGLVHAAFLGTTIVRADLERGTLGLLLTKPVGLPAYLAGRFLGLALSGLAVCAVVAAAMALVLMVPAGGRAADVFGPALLAGWGRCFLPILVLEAAALAASALAPRFLAPVVLVGLFVAGSVAGDSLPGLLLPDFGVFGLEAGGGVPSTAPLLVYSLVYSTVFMLIAYLVLASRAPLRSQA